MADRDGYPKVRWFVAGVALAVALAVYLWGAFTSPVFDQQRYRERAYLRAQLAASEQRVDREAALAEAYWRRYPDVAADVTYGPRGMGVEGARAHYRNHGKAEGRVWGPD